MSCTMRKEGGGSGACFPDIPRFDGRDYAPRNYALEQILTSMNQSARRRWS